MSPALCRLHTAWPEGVPRAPATRAHVASCLRCQATGARRRVLRRELAALGSEVLPAPPYLAASVMARLGPQVPRGARRLAAGPSAWRAAAAGMGVGAAAAAAVLTGLALRRSRVT